MITHVSPIIKPLEPTPLFSRRRWLIVQDWRHQLPDHTICLIPKGTVIDGASVPRPFNALVSPTGSLFIPSIIHDFGYQCDYLLVDEDSVIEKRHENAGRKHWDDLFFTVAEQHGQRSTAYHRMIWATIRMFGGIAWSHCRKPRDESFYQHQDSPEEPDGDA